MPETVNEAARVYLFQRTANWVIPKEDDPCAPVRLEGQRSVPRWVPAAGETRHSPEA